jgi:hypothetical protein
LIDDVLIRRNVIAFDAVSMWHLYDLCAGALRIVSRSKQEVAECNGFTAGYCDRVTGDCVCHGRFSSSNGSNFPGQQAKRVGVAYYCVVQMCLSACPILIVVVQAIVEIVGILIPTPWIH